MAYTTINKSSSFMNPKIYTGNGGTQSITGVGFQPDWVWIKNRSATENHFLQDAVRGSTKRLNSNTTNTEATEADGVTSFTSDGFNLGYTSEVNGNGNNIVSWNWKANGSGSSNTDGSINSTVSANTTSRFSIVKYQGTGANATVGHGLGAIPKMILFKSLANGISWIVYSSELDISSSNCLRLNGTNAAFTESAWYGTRPTTSVFSLGTHNEANNNSGETIAYCFAEVQGFSKIGSYIGNGGTDGPFIYTGFKPAFIFYKQSTGGTDWYIYDDKRDGKNIGTGASGGNRSLRPNTTSAEEQASGYPIDILSNGWKARSSSNQLNENSSKYVYMAFAEAPLVGTNNIPANAR